MNKLTKERKYFLDAYQSVLNNIDSTYVEQRVNRIVVETLIKGSKEPDFDYVEEALKRAWGDYDMFPFLTDNQLLSIFSRFDVWIEFVGKIYTPEKLKW